MPDGQNLDFGFPAIPAQPDPPTRLWPTSRVPEIIVDQYRVMLADPQGNFVGMPAPVPMLRMLQTTRNLTRGF